MSEEFASRTEAPTPRRREQARDEGQVAFSVELVTGVIVLAGIAVLSLGGGRLGGGLLAETRFELVDAGHLEMSVGDAQGMLGRAFSKCVELAAPFLVALFAGALAVCLIQVGVHVNSDLLALKWERLSPFGGNGRLFSANNAVRGVLAVVRLVAVGLVAWWVLAGEMAQIAKLGNTQLAPAVGQAWAIVLRLVLAIGGGLLLLGVGDYFFQRWRHERTLRMSREQIKDESKREDGDPHTKARIRRLQRETAKKKMLQSVKKATVVVTNPTHLAVALRYDRGKMDAPRVVAKGAGHVAKRIAELARRHGVPVLERKSLAQAIFRAVKLNQEIPLALYHAVAEVLAAVYRLRGAVHAGKPPENTQ